MLFVFALFMRSLHVLFAFALFMCSFYALFLCAFCICSFKSSIYALIKIEESKVSQQPQAKETCNQRQPNKDGEQKFQDKT